MSKKIDLTGKVFGRLTVIKEAGRNTIFVNGVSLSELCEEKKLDYGIVWQRIHKSKWSVEKALSTPINKRMCLK